MFKVIKVLKKQTGLNKQILVKMLFVSGRKELILGLHGFPNLKMYFHFNILQESFKSE